jgi:hypothetical protein
MTSKEGVFQLVDGDAPVHVGYVELYQTFPVSSSRRKVRENSTYSTSPTTEEHDRLVEDNAPGREDPVDDAVKARLMFSPDPGDYVCLGHTEYKQQCAACGRQGVEYRERPVSFNVRRGTAALCGTCYKGIAGQQEVEEEEAEEEVTQA